MIRILMPLVALPLCALTMFSSCASSKVDKLALFEPAELSWPAVENDYNRGIEDATMDGDLTTEVAVTMFENGVMLKGALEEKDADAVRGVPWAAMSPFVTRGIDDKLEDGEIGPGVAVSLREQLANFTTLIGRLKGL